MMPAGHHSDSDSTLLPLPKSVITWLGGIFARLPPLAARLYWKVSLLYGTNTNNINHFENGLTIAASREKLLLVSE